MKNYGSVAVETDLNRESCARLIGFLNLKPPVLIKPNWGTAECFTEGAVLDMVLAAITGDKLVIESHGWARNEETLLGVDPGGFTRANLRKGERWFLSHSGIDQVLEKHQVEYLNLTEEIWAGRMAEPRLIQEEVEQRFSPVQAPELYSRVPSRIYELRGGTLLSLAKYKIVFYPLGASLSVKNLFGLIPGPSRGRYHGKGHDRLDQSIVDINKLYRSLFSVKGMIEAVFSSGTLENEGERTRVHPGCGTAFASQDTISLDGFTASLGGRDPGSVGHLRLAAQTFGAWDDRVCQDAAQSGIKVIE